MSVKSVLQTLLRIPVAAILIFACSSTRSIDRIDNDVLLDISVRDFGSVCDQKCATPVRYTVVANRGDRDATLIVSGMRNDQRSISEESIRRLVSQISRVRWFKDLPASDCIHCRQWFVSFRGEGENSAVTTSTRLGQPAPQEIADVLRILGESPPN